MSNKFHYVVTGNPDDAFTSSEIYKDDECMGRIFELDDCWYSNVEDFKILKDPKIIDFIEEDCDDLKHYVNRKGSNPPEDMTAAGMSLWLMQRDDKKRFFNLI